MRRIAALVVLAIAASLSAVGAATAATPQQQINQLKAKVARLQNQMRAVQDELACYDTLAPIGQFGLESGPPQGYLYGLPDGQTVVVTTALDYTNPDQGTAGVDFDWYAIYDEDCAAAALGKTKRAVTASMTPAHKVGPRIAGGFRWHW
jgi:hypothetical protein